MNMVVLILTTTWNLEKKTPYSSRPNMYDDEDGNIGAWIEKRSKDG